MLVDKDPSTVGIAHYLMENSTDDSEIKVDDEVRTSFRFFLMYDFC